MSKTKSAPCAPGALPEQRATSLPLLLPPTPIGGSRGEHVIDTEALADFQERAAIMEFDGGLPRAVAERLAWQATWTRCES